MVDARYRNTKNGRVAVVVQEDLKCKTVLLQYEDDGKETQVATSTLKRWWEELDEDDEEVDDVEEDEEDDDEDFLDDEDDDEDDDFDDEEEEDEDDDEQEDDEDDDEEVADEDDDSESEDDEEEFAGDGTPLKEVGKQIAEQAKKKAEKAKAETKPAKKQKTTRNTKPENEGNAGIIEYLNSAIEKRGGIVQRHQTNYGNAGSYKVDGRRFGRYRSTKADIRIYFRYSLVKSLKNPAKNYPNEPFGAEYIFTKLTKEDKKLIDSLLDLAIKTQHDTNMQRAEKKKPKKTEKKEQVKKTPAAKKTTKKK